MRKGISPIIATVLLIAITFVIAAIVFLSGSDFIEQLSPAPYCGPVGFNAGIYGDTTDGQREYILEIENTGNANIEGFELIIEDKENGQKDIVKIVLYTAVGQSTYINLNDPNVDSEVVNLEGKQLAIVPVIKNAKDIPKPCATTFARFIQVETTAVPSAPVEPNPDEELPAVDPTEEPTELPAVDPTEIPAVI